MRNILFLNPNRMMDIMTSSMSRDEDSKPITLNITISAGLNKFKNTRINGVSKEYGEENDSYFWETEPPTSAVGVLRLHGLLFVGKSGIGGRNYKIAVVPKDIRAGIVELLK